MWDKKRRLPLCYVITLFLGKCGIEWLLFPYFSSILYLYFRFHKVNSISSLWILHLCSKFHCCYLFPNWNYFSFIPLRKPKKKHTQTCEIRLLSRRSLSYRWRWRWRWHWGNLEKVRKVSNQAFVFVFKTISLSQQSSLSVPLRNNFFGSVFSSHLLLTAYQILLGRFCWCTYYDPLVSYANIPATS